MDEMQVRDVRTNQSTLPSPNDKLPEFDAITCDRKYSFLAGAWEIHHEH